MTEPTPAEALATVLAHLQRGGDRRGFIGGPSAADCRVAIAEIGRLQESDRAARIRARIRSAIGSVMGVVTK